MSWMRGLVIKLGSVFLLAVFLFGCGTPVAQGGDTTVPSAPVFVSAASSPDTEESMLDSSLSLPMLMLHRQQLCLIPLAEKLRLLDGYRAVFVEQTAPLSTLPNVLPERLHKLNALMLASCDPARTPGVLSEMLGVVTEGHWPVEYMAFFDVLVASHRAYSLMDERYRNVGDERDELQQAYETLRADYEALEREHQKTIQGISDIERGIDEPRKDLGL